MDRARGFQVDTSPNRGRTADSLWGGMAEPRTAKASYVVAAKRTLIGSKVVNQQNQDLGKIEDLVIDAGGGRIAYAVLSFGGFLGLGDKYFAIPWQAFRFDLADKYGVLN